jgi:hypothetical protein
MAYPKQRNNPLKTFCCSIVLLAMLGGFWNISFAQDKEDQKLRDLETRINLLNAKIDLLETQIYEMDERVHNLTELQISGFFDVSFSNYKNQPNVFKMGIFELDVEHSYKNKFQVAAALVFDDEEGTYLGVGFIDYAFIGGAIPPRGRLFIERGFHIQVGRFDVPLGNDWNYVSAVRRYTVTPPLTSSHIMEGVYNDVGLRMLLNLVSFNFSIYSTRGIEEKYSYGGISYGTRIGLTPFNNPYTVKTDFVPSFELGVSYLYDLDNAGEKSEEVSVVDYESKIGAFILRSEVFKREKVAGVIYDGYHVTTGIDFDAIDWIPMIFILRYDSHQEENNVIASFDENESERSNDINTLTRATTAFRFNISDTSFLKLEYHKYLEISEQFKTDSLFSEELYYAQLVITF